MKDLVSYLLDINISMQSDATEKRLFNFVVLAINYYWYIQPPTPKKSIFLWLDGLSLLVSLPTNPNYTKSESRDKNYDMERVDNEMFWTNEMPSTNPNCTKSESHGNIYSKNYRDISNRMDIQELLSDNSKGPIDNYDIGRVGDKLTWTEKILPTDRIIK